MSAPTNNQFWKLRSKHGRDKIFSTPELLWESCEEYFEVTSNRKWVRKDWVGKDAVEVERETDAPFTQKGLFLFLDIDRKTWDLYAERQDFLPVVTRVEAIIYTQKFEGAVVGAFKESIIQNELGISKKVETDNKHTIEGAIIDWTNESKESK